MKPGQPYWHFCPKTVDFDGEPLTKEAFAAELKRTFENYLHDKTVFKHFSCEPANLEGRGTCRERSKQ